MNKASILGSTDVYKEVHKANILISELRQSVRLTQRKPDTMSTIHAHLRKARACRAREPVSHQSYHTAGQYPPSSRLQLASSRPIEPGKTIYDNEMASATTTFPNRAAFLATGLVPVPVPSSTLLEDCNICFDALAHPVQTPCGHVYCLEHITEWLTRDGKNTCPLCRKELFTLGNEEGLRVPSFRRERVAQALRISGLAPGSEMRLDDFGGEGMHFTVPQFQRAIASSNIALAHGLPNPVEGAASISRTHLAPHIISMGNLLPGWALVSQRPYTAAQRAAWGRIVAQTWYAVCCLDGQTEGADYVFAALERRVRAGFLGFVEGDDDLAGFFDENAGPDSRAGDLGTMFAYLVQLGVEKARREREGRRKSGRNACSVM